MSYGQGAQLVDVQLVVADWYRKRLGTFFRRTLNQGLGAYLIFAISLTIALISARLAWVGGMEDRTYVSDLLKTKVQPQSEATRGVVLSLLLSGLDKSPISDELYCNGPSVGACEVGTRVWRKTQGLVDAIEAIPASNPKEESAADSLARISVNPTIAPFSVDEKKRLLDNLSERGRLLRSASSNGVEIRDEVGDRCGDRREIANRAQAFYLAVPTCVGKAADFTTEVVPQQVADALDVPPAAGTMQSDASLPANGSGGESNKHRTEVRRLRDFRVLRAQLDSELFDIVIRQMQAELVNSQGDVSDPSSTDTTSSKVAGKSGPIIAAAFFISVDSVIRYWARTGQVEAGALPAHRLWASRPYFETMLNNVDATSPLITRAYMDFAGHGVVYTECHPLTAAARLFPSRGADEPADPLARNILADLKKKEPRIIVGAVCVDFAISNYGVKALIENINSGPVADADLIVFAKGPAGKWYSENVAQGSWADSRDLSTALAAAAEDFSKNAASRRDILPLDLASKDESVFLIPLRIRNNGKLEAIVLRVKGVGPLGSRPEAMLCTLIFGAIALGSLLAGFRSSKAVAVRERLLGRLRSLQVGVIQTDWQDHITAANDRAEELLDRSLPPFGIEAREFPRFWKIFDPESILLVRRDDLNRLVTNWSLSDVAVGDRNVIREDRRQGKTTAYFLRLTLERTSCGAKVSVGGSGLVVENDTLSPSWIRITAGPILRPLKGVRFWSQNAGTVSDELDATFGLVEPVSLSLGDDLDGYLETLRNGKRSVTGGMS